MSHPIPYRFPFAKFPAVRIALLFAAGIVAGVHISVEVPIPILLITLLSTVLFASEYRFHRSLDPFHYRISTACYLGLLVLFGMAWYQLREHAENHASGELLDAFVWEQIEVSGEIYSIRTAGSGNILIDIAADTTRLGDSLYWHESYNLRTILDPAGQEVSENLRLGYRMQLLATVFPAGEPRNPHEFNYRAYLKSKKIAVQAGIDTVYTLTASGNGLSWTRLRQQVLDLIALNFSPGLQPLAKALLIGYKNDLDSEEKAAFSRVGLSHIMAVSGLHVGFIIAPFWLLIPWFWTFKFGKQAGLVLLVVILAGYAGLTGFSASVNRAALTGGFITYGRLFHKVRDSLNLTAVAAIILLAIDPNELFDPGFQLSFSAVFVILLTLPVLNRVLPASIRNRWHGKLVQVVAVSLVVQFGLFPLLAYHFGEFSLVGPLANALVVPALGLVVPYSLALLPVSAFAPNLGIMLNLPNEWFLTALDTFVQVTAGLEGSWMRIHLGSTVIFLIWIAGILLVASLEIPALRWKMLALFLGLLILESGIRLSDSLKAPVLTVTIFDVGQGDAALVETPRGKKFLIDTGRWTPGYNSAHSIILPHLRAEGIDRLDALILSHPHADHIGGTAELINEIPVDTIFNSGYEYDSGLYRSYQEMARRKGVPVKSLKAGDKLLLDSAIRIFVYGPSQAGSGGDPNEHSLILELIYGDTEFLFTGDAGRAQEKRLADNFGPLLDTDFLKVGHHGSRTSSSASFLDLATADIAVISLAKLNRFRHPHPEAVERLEKRTGKVYYTSLDKALIFISDGREIRRVEW